MVNTGRVALGVAALRSGEFARGPEYLHNLVTGKMCCLGVFTYIAIRNGLDITVDTSGDHAIFGGQDGETLCWEVSDWYGFDDDDPLLEDEHGNGGYATKWNDDGDPAYGIVREDFTDIADAFGRAYLS